jgi:hypothetical protein
MRSKTASLTRRSHEVLVMTEQTQQSASKTASSAHEKAPVAEMSNDRKLEVVVQLTDDVLAKLTGAFFEVMSKEKWGKRDLALISGLNETAIGHILAGRRKNLTIETIALLARSMLKRPELVLHDTRPQGNRAGLPSSAAVAETPLQVSSPVRSMTTIESSSAATAFVEGLPTKSALQVLEMSTGQQAGRMQNLEQ